MANYEAYARSNYFHVNNMKNFLEWMKMYLPDAHLFTKDNKKKEAITEQDLVAFGMESVFYLEDEDQAISKLQELLLEGEACVVVETGHEKLRYVTGHSAIFTKIQLSAFHWMKKHAAVVQNCWGSQTINWISVIRRSPYGI